MNGNRAVNRISKASPLSDDRSERLAVFIDGANLYAASRTLGFDVDYKNLLAYFRKQGYLVRAYYYTALLETDEYSPLRPLVDWLGYNGYAVVTKPAKEFTDATGRRRVKGSVDIEMAVDVLDLAAAPRPRGAVLGRRRPPAVWWRRCSGAGSASPWSPPSAPSRR